MFQKKSSAKLRQQNIKKTVYHYNKLTDEDWNNYAVHAALSGDVLELDSPIDDLHDLNKRWTEIQTAITSSAATYLHPHKTVIKKSGHR